ncbi:Quinate dehydrogenase [Pseudocercospora fuligena]|uniref:Quinate dehydrogenase n=1 Tax=Pseudocercospora fuligena TaxID=685502 RepID=A0A8H6RCZ0_9PEZI|nr:Quinate dehydrogenase [Pseudocercospora fuligena]
MEIQENSVITCPAPAVDHLERHGYLFGYPIAHSYSPYLHNTVFEELGLPWGFRLLESTDMSQFLTLLKDPRLYGSAVTMPHKVAIIPHLDDLTEEGRAVGAVNTIFRRGDQFVGTNTDTIGVRESFYQNISRPDEVFHGRPGMVVGGGGAARSAVYALVKFMRCEKVYVVNRDPSEVEAVISWCKSQGYGDGLIHVKSAAEAETLEGPGAIVACVPNFPPVTDAEKEARKITEIFLNKSHKGAMLEMCYHPSPWTELGSIAEKAGWQVILGTEAMIYQGLEQHTLWHGRTIEELPVAAVKEVIAQELAKARL